MRRMMLSIAAISALTVATAAQQPTPQPAPRFEVISVKPNTGSDLSISFGLTPPEGLTMINRSLESIVRYAFRVDDKRLSGLPAMDV